MQYVATPSRCRVPTVVAGKVGDRHLKLLGESFARVLTEVRREDGRDVARSTGTARGAAHEVAGFKELQIAVLRNEAGRAGHENTVRHSHSLTLLDAVRAATDEPRTSSSQTSEWAPRQRPLLAAREQFANPRRPVDALSTLAALVQYGALALQLARNLTEVTREVSANEGSNLLRERR